MSQPGAATVSSEEELFQWAVFGVEPMKRLGQEKTMQ
jgi:hypothetical protein